MMSDTFERANRLWFHEGRTFEALAAYEEALRATPVDPVLAFQFARALWSMDRFDEARFLLEQARMHSSNLSATGQRLLESWRTKLQQRPPERPLPELPPALLDRDRLEAGPLPVSDWLTVADAAAARRMYGLALYALDRRGGVHIDAEDAMEMDHIETNRNIEETMLAQMYANSEPSQEPIEVQRSPIQSIPAQDRSVPPLPHQTARLPVSEDVPVELPLLPLNLTVRVTPVEGRVGVPTTLVASLSNPTDTVQVVNRRLLLNHFNAPGEIWLDVQGPEGYRNTSGFRMRAGDAPNEFFVSLVPGQAVDQSWQLNDYQSLHVPGEYEVTITYHNEATRAPDGRLMAVGKVAGSTRFHRHA